MNKYFQFLFAVLLILTSFFISTTTIYAQGITIGGITYDCSTDCNSFIDPFKGQCETLKADNCSSNSNCSDPVSNPEGCKVNKPRNLPTKLGDIGGIVSTVTGAAILIAAILAFLYLIWGGIQWITSGGDQSALEAARGRITAAIVGLVIVGAAWGIFIIIQNVFGFNNILQGG